MVNDYYSSGSGCQGTASARSVSVRNYGDPIAADPPGGWGGWGLGKPDRTVWPTARLSVAGTPVPTYDDGFPKAPPTPPALSAVLKVGSRTRGARLSCAAGRDGGRPTFLRHAGLRSAVIVGSPRESFAARLRGPSAAWRAGETGGLSETRRSTSGQAYRLPTFRRTASRSDRVSEGPPVSPARRTSSQGSN